VIIVSDEDGFTHLLRTLLEDLNLTVCCSTMSSHAVQEVEHTLPDLVILDLIPGYETTCWLVLEALKARPSTQRIPILLCPAAPWLAETHAHRLAMHGVQTWTNAFDLHDLLTRVQSAVDHASESVA